MEGLAWAAIVTLFLNAVSTFFDGFQSYQNRKTRFFNIDQEFRNRYAQLVDERKELDRFYDDPDFDLEDSKLKSENIYDRIIHAEKKFFWFSFDQWYLGHVDKTAPRHLKKIWDYSLQVSVKEPLHHQVWKHVFKNKDFRGQKDFNKFINNAISGL